MNTMTQAVHEYVSLRRGLGFKLYDDERELLQFAAFLEARKAPCITRELALEWAQQPQNVLPSRWARRLTYVRGFARYRQGADPRTEVPVPGLLPSPSRRRKPYRFSDQEIQALHKLPYHYERDALRPWVYYCLFGLLSVTGLRSGEARNLELRDVDINAALLTVRMAKHNRTRLVPLHESTCSVLADYLSRRQRHWDGRTVSDHLFLSGWGNQLNLNAARRTFHQLLCQIGLHGHQKCHPHLHNLRHRFAVKTLENWYRQGDHPERLLPVLSTYLGHVCIADTYWYLEASPGLMTEAMRRLERRWEDRSWVI